MAPRIDSCPHVTRVVGRFAPSPTGYLHAGNVFSYLLAWIVAKRASGSIVLRIEDLDPARSQQRYTDQLLKDLEALGLSWDEGPYYQSERTEAYRAAYDKLLATGRVYPCFCSRADVHAAWAPHAGESPVYAGTCRNLTEAERAARRDEIARMSRSESWRLAVPDVSVAFSDRFQGCLSYNLASQCGDFVIRRSDRVFSYQLAVVVDDEEMGVNSVVRGADLLASTPLQLHLQDTLGFGHPAYAHVPVLVSSDGSRLAKRHKAASLDDMKAQLGSYEAVLGRIAHITGLIDQQVPTSADELLHRANLDALSNRREIVWEMS